MRKRRSSEQRALFALADACEELLSTPTWRLTVDDATSPLSELIACADYQWVYTDAPATPVFEMLVHVDSPWLADDGPDDSDASWELRTAEHLYINKATVIDFNLDTAPIGYRDLEAVIGGRVVRWHKDSKLRPRRDDWATLLRKLLLPPSGDQAVIVEEDERQMLVRYVSEGVLVWAPIPTSDPVFVLEKGPTGTRLTEVRHPDGRLLNHVERLDDPHPPCPVDVATLEVIDADEALELLRAAYPRIRPRPPRRQRGRATLHLLEPDDPGEGWSLTSYDLPERADLGDASDLDRTITAFILAYAEDLIDAIELDSEGGMFCARAHDPAHLRRLATLVKTHLVAGAELE